MKSSLVSDSAAPRKHGKRSHDDERYRYDDHGYPLVPTNKVTDSKKDEGGSGQEDIRHLFAWGFISFS